MRASLVAALCAVVLLFTANVAAQDHAASSAVSVVGIERAPYRNPRYRQQCRYQGRISAHRAETIEDKGDARRRARALARAGELDLILLFSRMAYGEEGTPNPGSNDDGYEAMLAVLDFRRSFYSLHGSIVPRAHVISRIEMFAAYSPRRVFPNPRDPRNLWIAELELNGHRPPSWPRPRGVRAHHYPPWISYGCPRWLAAIDEVRVLFARAGDNIGAGPCREVPHHWGGDMDDHRSDRRWRPISCGTTEDTFYVVSDANLIDQIDHLEVLSWR